jgi:hypothetical protein
VPHGSMLKAPTTYRNAPLHGTAVEVPREPTSGLEPLT